MEVIEVDPLADDRWESLARSWPESDVFHSPAWLSVLARTYGFRIGARLVRDGSAVVGGAVYADVPAGRRLRRRSLAFSDFCDPLVGDRPTWELLVASLLEDGHPLTIRCRRSRLPGDDARFERTGEVAWHRCDVSRGSEEIWNSIHPSARRAVRKAEATGVEIEAATGLEDVRDFYALHLEVRAKKYGLLAQPFAFFEHIWETFLASGRGELLLARSHDRIVGGTLFLDWGSTAYYKFNASDAGSLGVRPNDLLLWSGIERARKRGLAWLDFGVSDLDQPGLVRFKEKYATEVGEVVTFATPTAVPAHERDIRALLTQVSGMLAADGVPRRLTERGGELLYRYFG